MRRIAVLSILPLLLGASARAPAENIPASARLPLPDAAAQERARKMIHDIFKDDFSKTAPNARQALARRLLTEAAGTKDDLDARYVLLSDAAGMAATVGDSATAVAAIDALGRQYKVDVIALRRAALLRANAAVHTPDAAETLAQLCLDTADAAALADAFDIVEQMTNLAEAAGQKTGKVTVVAGMQVHLANLRALTAEFAQVKKSLDILANTPDDPAANLAVGTFYALHKGQWAAGLPCLAKGGDAALRALATKELAAPTDGLAQAALGDAWWAYAEKSDPTTRDIVRQHAVLWYGRAQQSLAGITRTRIEQRMKEAASDSATAKANPNPGLPIASTSGPAVNILALVDPARDRVDGKWAATNGALTVASSRYAALQLPYSMPEEFDLRVSFTRDAGQGSIAILLAGHKRTFDLALDVKGEARFERVDNKIAKANPTTVPVLINNGPLYTVTVQVRKDGVAALLDGRPLTHWKTDYKDLTRYALWKLADEKMCGLGVNNAKVTFHSIEVIEVTGSGKPLR